MKRMYLVGAYRLRAVLIFAALGVSVCRGQVWYEQEWRQDQANMTVSSTATNIMPVNRVSQTFVPSLACLTSVEVRLKTLNLNSGGDWVTLQILNSAGEVLDSTTDNIPAGYELWRFYLSPKVGPPGYPVRGVIVTPGQPFIIRLQDTGKNVFGWKYNGGNPYPAGQAYFYGSPYLDNDFLFTTYGVTRCEGLDQANAPASASLGTTNILPASKGSQTFVPSLACLENVEAELNTINFNRGGDTVTAQILDSAGRVLSSTSPYIPEGFEGFWPFHLLGVTVTPSQPLTIRLQDTGKGVFGWRYSRGNTYPAGQSYYYGSPSQDNDYLFTTYGMSAWKRRNRAGSTSFNVLRQGSHWPDSRHTSVERQSQAGIS